MKAPEYLKTTMYRQLYTGLKNATKRNRGTVLDEILNDLDGFFNSLSHSIPIRTSSVSILFSIRVPFSIASVFIVDGEFPVVTFYDTLRFSDNDGHDLKTRTFNSKRGLQTRNTCFLILRTNKYRS